SSRSRPAALLRAREMLPRRGGKDLGGYGSPSTTPPILRRRTSDRLASRAGFAQRVAFHNYRN
ncbi:MAG TPA: hypothetical protein VF960_03100, partial [Chloroflexota bacterium]